MIFRILTEHKDNLRELTQRYFQGCTRIAASGDWEGITEASAIIEIDSVGADVEFTCAKVNALAADIKRVNNQQAVLVQAIQAESRLI